VYSTLWKKIDELVQSKNIVVCSEIKDEVKDEDMKEWLQKNECEILEIDAVIQNNVRRIVSEHPELLDFVNIKSSADSFLIATAMKYSISVITEESKSSSKKIPAICRHYDISCYNLTELAEKEGWSF
jgi:nicotinic acid mononucleotide adenylyltransferase